MYASQLADDQTLTFCNHGGALRCECSERPAMEILHEYYTIPCYTVLY